MPATSANTNSNCYVDTRQMTQNPLSFSQAIVKGIASGGGLFVPQTIPTLTLDEILSLADMSYADRAATIFSRFDTDFDNETIKDITHIAYGDNFDDRRITPIVEVAPNMHVMELWHGPTSAFKDMALQCLPVFFSRAVAKLKAQNELDSDFLILVATSGDTGKAALEGFKDREHVKIVVFYPDGGVSDIQFKQMATQRGSNLCVFGATGNFDDCQTSVKQTFADSEFADMLATQKSIKLSSANSINWGRLMPQIVYYVSAYSTMVKDGKVKGGNPIDICVPTGNFGNILGAYYAKCMGTPIRKLICASNENRILTDFINTGVYDISNRQLVLTPSPSMDILVSSNMERQLFELCGRDGTKIKTWMDQLNNSKKFEIDKDLLNKIQDLYTAGSISNDESLEIIREVHNEHDYLIDPHTAVAWGVAQNNLKDVPMLIVSTAHWAKFGDDVYRAIHGLKANSELPKDIQKLTGAQLNNLIAQETSSFNIPSGLAELDNLSLRFKEICNATKEEIEKVILEFLS